MADISAQQELQHEWMLYSDYTHSKLSNELLIAIFGYVWRKRPGVGPHCLARNMYFAKWSV
jgi:hypothetical protein